MEAALECVYLPDKSGTNPFEWASDAANEYYFEYLQSAIAKTEGKAAQKLKVSVEPKLGINNAEPDPSSNLSTANVKARQQRGKQCLIM
ncbi:hypothetical protein [Wolbachia endosymbiont (group E) of Neria commutata]|uniref:hypothetical protein n=1 Tax=Wolbachia endosymbiont (group E) of Neria commutata TaxID=3066149 RepID=UPI003132C8E1